MTTKRRSLNIQKDSLFGGSGIGQQLDDDAAHAGEGTIMSIPLDAIELDEKNARTEGKLTIEQIIAHRSGATDLATLTDKSQLAFFEDLVQLSNALTHHGQFDPILVYEVRQHFGDAPRYKNLGGERRILASYLAGKKTIRATVRPRPENPLVERALALMHNTQRRELSTREKILGIKDVIDLYESIHGRFPNGKELQDVIHEDYRSCARYLRYVTGPSAVLSAIRAGRINSVRAIEYVMVAGLEQDLCRPVAALVAGDDLPCLLERPGFGLMRRCDDLGRYEGGGGGHCTFHCLSCRCNGLMGADALGCTVMGVNLRAATCCGAASILILADSSYGAILAKTLRPRSPDLPDGGDLRVGPGDERCRTRPHRRFRAHMADFHGLRSGQGDRGRARVPEAAAGRGWARQGLRPRP